MMMFYRGAFDRRVWSHGQRVHENEIEIEREREPRGSELTALTWCSFSHLYSCDSTRPQITLDVIKTKEKCFVIRGKIHFRKEH